MLGRLEDRDGAGGDVNGVSCPGIPCHPRFSTPDLEGPKSANLDILTLCQSQFDGTEKAVYYQGAVLLRDPWADRVRDLLD
jgi:hypothetical protein